MLSSTIRWYNYVDEPLKDSTSEHSWEYPSTYCNYELVGIYQYLLFAFLQQDLKTNSLLWQNKSTKVPWQLMLSHEEQAKAHLESLCFVVKHFGFTTMQQVY